MIAVAPPVVPAVPVAGPPDSTVASALAPPRAAAVLASSAVLAPAAIPAVPPALAAVATTAPRRPRRAGDGTGARAGAPAASIRLHRSPTGAPLAAGVGRSRSNAVDGVGGTADANRRAPGARRALRSAGAADGGPYGSRGSGHSAFPVRPRAPLDRRRDPVSGGGLRPPPDAGARTRRRGATHGRRARARGAGPRPGDFRRAAGNRRAGGRPASTCPVAGAAHGRAGAGGAAGSRTAGALCDGRPAGSALSGARRRAPDSRRTGRGVAGGRGPGPRRRAFLRCGGGCSGAAAAAARLLFALGEERRCADPQDERRCDGREAVAMHRVLLGRGSAFGHPETWLTHVPCQARQGRILSHRGASPRPPLVRRRGHLSRRQADPSLSATPSSFRIAGGTRVGAGRPVHGWAPGDGYRESVPATNAPCRAVR